MAGNRDALRWQEGTFDKLYGYSGGVPRLINVFCDFVLLAAFAEETRELSVAMIDEVIGDVSWDRKVDAARLQQPFARGDEKGDVGLFLRFEDRLAALDAMHEEDGWIARCLSAQEDLLQQLSDHQHADAERMDSSLDRIFKQLEMLMNKPEKSQSYVPSSSSPLRATDLAKVSSTVKKSPMGSPKATVDESPPPKKHWFRR